MKISLIRNQNESGPSDTEMVLEIVDDNGRTDVYVLSDYAGFVLQFETFLDNGRKAIIEMGNIEVE